MQALEIQIDGPHNECLSFRPLPGQRIRGAFDFNRCAEPMARMQTQQWPVPIPGQILGVDPSGDGYVREPLHDPEHAAIREKILKKDKRLAPAVEEFVGIDRESWIYWMARAVQSGIAKVVTGKLPEKLPEKPRRNYILAETVSRNDKLADAIDRQTAVFEKLLAKLGEK